MSRIYTTPGGINPQPRTLLENNRNWQLLAKLLAAGALVIGPNGQLTINVSAPLDASGASLALDLDEVSGLVVFNGTLAANTHIYTAGATLSGGKVVATSSGNVIYADSATTTAGTVVGMTRGAIANGAAGEIITAGRLTGLSGLTPGAVYWIGTAGAITSIAPTTGLVQQMGVALDATTFVLEIGQPFVA